MKTLLFILAALPMICCGSTERSACDKVKTGKFYYFTKKTREKIIIERSETVQIETAALGDPAVKSKIVWKSDCKFNMYINSLNQSSLTGFDSLLATIPSEVDIIHINDSFYICIAKINYKEIKAELRDTMYFLR